MIQNKHIIRLSFFGLFLTIITSFIFYRYYMIETVVLQQVTKENAFISTTYSQNIWHNNLQIVKKLTNNDYRKLINDQDFIKFTNISIDFFLNNNKNVTLLNKQGIEVFTSANNEIAEIFETKNLNMLQEIIHQIDKYFLKRYISYNPMHEAFAGKTVHHLTPNAEAIDFNDNHFSKSLVTSYIPIINYTDGNFDIDGVLKITTDITDQWNNISQLEKTIFVTFLIVFLLFFIVVMHNTSYTQKIINQQHEINTQLTEARIKAENESIAKTEFLANISHELRTPLNAVIGFSEIIIAETHGKITNEKYLEYIYDINNSGKHLLGVINDILDISKVSVGKLKIDHIEVNLKKIITSSIRFIETKAISDDVTINTKLPKEHMVIMADPKRLKQAFLNLLSNAIKFTPRHGNIDIHVVVDKSLELVKIIVIDNGIGMKEHDIPKAFSNFGQVNSAIDTKLNGTGLGLPLTRKLIELMNGTLDITSIKNKGTIATVIFPYKEFQNE